MQLNIGFLNNFNSAGVRLAVGGLRRRALRVRLPCTPANTTQVLPKKSHGHSDRGEFSNRNHLAAGHQTIEAFCRLFLHPGKKMFIPIQGECPENSAAADDCRDMCWYRAEPEDTRSS